MWCAQHNVGSRLDQPKAPDASQAKVALSFAKCVCTQRRHPSRRRGPLTQTTYVRLALFLPADRPPTLPSRSCWPYPTARLWA